ncbi:MAG: exosortase F system-associated protein [Bacteroidetes bacterium]|nr:exosortase F system-associated protein [Bacteroidota bacterium]
MLKGFRIGLIVLLIGFLIGMRSIADNFFYDPLVKFFKGEYLYNSLPEFNYVKLFLNVFLRYFLNSIISLAIMYLIFLKKDIVVFSAFIYLFGFLFFAMLYYVLLVNYINEQYLILFYVRRILIQPMLILLLIPAFYYFKKTEN